jgi:hypothetical protein
VKTPLASSILEFSEPGALVRDELRKLDEEGRLLHPEVDSLVEKTKINLNIIQSDRKC